MLKPNPSLFVPALDSRLGIAILALLTLASVTLAAPVQLVDESPVSVERISPQVILVDFGRVSFGNLRLIPPANFDATISVHFGESLQKGRINRNPPGSVRYSVAQVHLLGDSPTPECSNPQKEKSRPRTAASR